MKRANILLVDLRKHLDEPHLLKSFEAKWSVQRVQPDPEAVVEMIGAYQPQILFFDYDFPDIPSLLAMKESKVVFPSVPIVMVTEQHSEALAMWAHRARVWDYFFKPVSEDELIDCHETLVRLIPENKENGGSRKVITRSCPIPDDVRFRDKNNESGRSDVNPAIEYVTRMLTQKITQSDAAKCCNMNAWCFSRSFKKNYNMTFQEYVVRRRMQEAMRLLKHPSAAVTDVCFSVGYTDLSYFTRTFRRYIGTSPSVYKNQLNNVRQELNKKEKSYVDHEDLELLLN